MSAVGAWKLVKNALLSDTSDSEVVFCQIGYYFVNSTRVDSTKSIFFIKHCLIPIISFSPLLSPKSKHNKK